MVHGAQAEADGRQPACSPSLAACDGGRAAHPVFRDRRQGGALSRRLVPESGEDGRPSWADLPPGRRRPPMQWTLYDLPRTSRSPPMSRRPEPARLKAMLALWKQEATRNNVFPLDHRFAMARGAAAMRGSGRKHFDFWGKDVSIPTKSEPMPDRARASRWRRISSSTATDASGSGGRARQPVRRLEPLPPDRGRPAFTWSRLVLR
jgi:hypothetical protein